MFDDDKGQNPPIIAKIRCIKRAMGERNHAPKCARQDEIVGECR
jgi:hypothetical protein